MQKFLGLVSRQIVPLFILIIAVATLIVVAPLILGSAGVINDPDQAGVLGATIVDYALPPGYQENEALNLGIYKLVLITPGGTAPAYHEQQIIALVSYPADSGLSEEQVQQELRSAMLKMSEEVSSMETVGAGTGSLRGETIRLSQHESFTESDPPVRMLFTSAFEGKSGLALVMFAGPIDGWDRDLVTNFLAGIE